MQKKEYMLRAIELAKQGVGWTSPNPLVGAVIVKDGRIIGEGYHEKYGELHAERNAIKHLKESAEGATIYVTLEPCCHYGKQPPCTEAIAEAGIKKVVIGSRDPNPLVAGKGVRFLRTQGIEVEEDFMREECDALNPVFFHFIQTKRPYIVMKYAMTLDGKTACDNGESKWITSETARENVQYTRNALKGIMVGVGTVINDNPNLTCRIDGGVNPVRIICDSNLRTPKDCNIVRTAFEVPTIIATVSEDEKLIKFFEQHGIDVIKTAKQDNRVDLCDLMLKLGERKIDGLLLEGGGTLNMSALKAGIVNHIQAYIAPKIFGGSGIYNPVKGESVSVPSVAYICKNINITHIGDDILIDCDV